MQSTNCTETDTFLSYKPVKDKTEVKRKLSICCWQKMKKKLN